MLGKILNILYGALGFSLLGCVEGMSVAFILYYVYTKTRAPAIVAGLFPNLRLNMNYRSSLNKFNNISNGILITLKNGTKSEPKREGMLAHGIGTRDMLNMTPHAGRRPYNSPFDWGVYFPFVAQAVRSRKFQYPQISNLVLKDPGLQHAIRQAAEQILREQRLKEIGREDVNSNSHKLNGKEDGVCIKEHSQSDYEDILHRQERRAVAILRDMRSTLNNFLLGLTSWLLYKLFPWFLSGVVTHTKQIEMLKATSERAPGIPLIFLPLHRSHLDYIMVTFILTNNDIRSPLVAAGNNLQIPVFGSLLRGLGAFFIKRKMDPADGKKDILYRAVLHLYLQHALKMGHNIEFFIEGGRTRTGKPCMPKGGILSIIVNAFMDGSIPDALLVPVSVNYERLVDGNFVHEQKGEKKVPESFGKAIASIWKALTSKYGLMRIDFNTPYSIRELIESYNKIGKEAGCGKVFEPFDNILEHNNSTSSLYGLDVVCEEHRNLIESISRQVVYDCAAATSVMSTNALAFLLLTQYRKGGTDLELAKGLDVLRKTLEGRRDMGFSGESLHIINYATDLLGESLIKRTQDTQGNCFISPVRSIESMIELAYYSNMLTPHFALQSILLTTFHALLPKVSSDIQITREVKTRPGVTRRQLIERSLQNCEIFRYEYILSKPTQVLEDLLEVALDDLLIEGLIKVAQEEVEPESIQEGRRIARNLATYLDETDEYDLSADEDDRYTKVVQNEEPNMFLASETIAAQRALCEVLAPCGHTYLCVVQSLFILYKNSMLDTEFIKFVISEITIRVKSGKCPYAESISTDSVRNCLKLLEKWCIIEISNQHGLRLLTLSSPYETSEDSIKNIIQRFSSIVPNYKNGYF